jgi:hypothetical protein
LPCLKFAPLHPLQSSLIDFLLEMVEAQCITEPRLLSDITIGLSSLSIKTSEPSQSRSQTQHVKLVLLQPLANADTLAACRDPDSRLVRKPDGVVCSTSNHEYLNIRSLSVAWRQAVMKVAPISQITFDLTLPKRDENTSAFQKVYWDTAMPQEGGLAVRTRDIMTLAATIATGMRMRANGDLRFGVTYDKTEGILLKAITGLEKQLLALAEYRAPVKDGDRRDQDGAE